MMKTQVAALLLRGCGYWTVGIRGARTRPALTEMNALRAAVRADKKAFVASTLNLTDAEAKKFWPIYDAYQRDLDLANRRRNVVVVDVVGLDKPIPTSTPRTWPTNCWRRTRRRSSRGGRCRTRS